VLANPERVSQPTNIGNVAKFARAFASSPKHSTSGAIRGVEGELSVERLIDGNDAVASNSNHPEGGEILELAIDAKFLDYPQ
jgi:hypothetical protein